jgi:hypothetical protein
VDIRSIGDRLEPQLRRDFLTAVERARALVSERELVRLIEAGNTTAIEALGVRLAEQGLIPSFRNWVWTIGQVAVQSAQTVTPLLVAPALTRLSQQALAWVETHAAAMVTGIGWDTTQAIRQVVADGYIRGIGAPAMGRQIRASIGLLPSHAMAVTRYEAQMREKGVPEKVVVRNVETYRRRLLAWRAEMIARTETMMAAHAGLVAGWRVAAGEGRLPAGVRIRWMVTDDDRLCERCAPMDGMTVDLMSEEMFVATVKGFPNGMLDLETPGSRRKRKGGLRPGSKRAEVRDESLDGVTVPLSRPVMVAHPPLHPACRCSLVLAL